MLKDDRSRKLMSLRDYDFKAWQALSRGDMEMLSEEKVDIGHQTKLGFQERAAYYIFSYPGEHNDYLVCTDCGKIETLSLKCPVEALEKEVMANSGFSGIYHELEFFGQCPACA